MIRIVHETGSTNADLAALIGKGSAPDEGDWLVADRQTAGRGRLGRSWHDGLGNFMGSTVVRLGRHDPPPGTLSLVTGIALSAVIAPLIPAPQIAMLKWPNDLLIAGAKLSGILLERVSDWVVVGVGVNLAVAPDLPDRPTVALSHFGPRPDRDLFAAMLAEGFAAELQRWRSFGAEPVIARWLAAAHAIGTPLQVIGPDGQPEAGCFAGLAGDGALQLRRGNGTTIMVHAGEVRLADRH